MLAIAGNQILILGPSTSSRLLELSHLLRLAAVAAIVSLFACGHSDPQTTLAPTSSGGPQVSATVSPVPVPMRAQSPSRYQITVDVTFRETAGIGGRIAQMDVAIITSNGDGSPRTVSLDLRLPPAGTIKQSIVESVDAPAGQPPYQLRVVATGVDEAGKAFAVSPVQVPLVMTAASDVPPAPDVVFVGAGDIAVCGASGAEATARLLDRMPGSIFTLGDNVYPRGTSEQFTNCYAPTWGRHLARTYPTPGNHDWEVDAGAPYFSYFGQAAGPVGRGYYSYTLGGWHILSLNSNVPAVPGSAQYEWAQADLSTSRASCTLTYWHHPLFSSGPNGNNGQMREMWRLLQSYGVEIVLTGHDHQYERFAPQDADGLPDPHGIREFVVGTGGAGLYQPKAIQPNSEVRENQTWGILRLTLHARDYDWEFVPVEGQSFRDFGSGSCSQ